MFPIAFGPLAIPADGSTAIQPFKLYKFLHWGGRNDGLRAAALEELAKPPHLRNPLVTGAISDGYLECTV